jgi:Rho family, other
MLTWRHFVRQVDNRDSLENAGTRWINEIAERVQGDFKIVLVALKCDLREENEKEGLDDEAQAEDSDTRPEREESGKKKDQTIQYHEGLEVAKKIGALRYLGNCGLQSPSFPHTID